MPGNCDVVYETGRSALVVPVPDAEPAVGIWRARHDSSAPFGMPAHITVLYPFLSEDRLTQAVVDRLKEICDDTRVMEVELRQARRFPGMLYLAPDPDDGFRRLTEAVVQEWPEAPPYGGAHDDNIPHLTVAHDLTDELLDEIDHLVTGSLPIRTRLTSASLYVFDSARWRVHHVLPFG
jgi:2'-5' RNA ligase